MYGKLAAKVNNIDNTGFVLKTKYDTDDTDIVKRIGDAEKNIPNTSEIIKKQTIILRLLT